MLGITTCGVNMSNMSRERVNYDKNPLIAPPTLAVSILYVEGQLN